MKVVDDLLGEVFSSGVSVIFVKVVYKKFIVIIVIGMVGVIFSFLFNFKF